MNVPVQKNALVIHCIVKLDSKGKEEDTETLRNLPKFGYLYVTKW